MPENNEAKWYIIHTFGGYEKKVKMAIDNYADAQGLRDIIQEVLLPTDLVVETKNGKRKEKEVLRFPNYLFLKLVYGNNDKVDKELWYRIRNTNGVTGFVAPDPNKPSPMSDEDLIKMGLIVPSTVEVDYEVGDLIIITDGPFKDSKAIVKDINEEKQQVTVTVSMFGRETPLTLDFIKVRKV
ncbi:MAG: transcription termination/antitermination protein NusG [Saccharofermentans sp.]|jgi:transcriptional antiterminator NusG|nr:transcription termination/antitermination protein NusG [Saccharofermentans sp.]